MPIQVVASWLHWGLFGTLSVQLCTSLIHSSEFFLTHSRLDLYYLAFPNDKKFTKYLVYGVYVVELAQTILASHDAFGLFGYDFGNFEALTEIRLNWLTIPIMSASCNYLELYNQKTNIAVGIWCGGYALCDVIIAICMTHYLMRSNTGFHQTQILVTKLVRLVIETGTVTAAVALLNLILFFAMPGQSFYTTPALLMPKLYANAIYMVLNSRIRIVGGRDTYTSSTDMIIPTGNTMLRDARTGVSSCDTQGSAQR
ncbi:hypothetical protein IW262DRAFT_1294738 [Armillaria fumosa]|nr:hypothetical protein IW262DRAFT_1294738 [Armillaria fumosa]